MINWNDLKGNGCGLILRYYPRICLKGQRKTIKILSEWLVSVARFEPGTSRIKSRSVNHLTMMFGASQSITINAA
jgi:hypothetical protein